MANKPTQLLRCIVYDVLFYPYTLIVVMVGIPFTLSQRLSNMYVRLWTRGFFWLTRRILGIQCHFEPKALKAISLENTHTTQRKGVVIAAKHQSAWETIALRAYYPRAVSVAKRELFWLPIGWFLWRMGFIPVNRKGGARALKKMMAQVKRQLELGNDVVIYPEGTRTLVGAKPNYKSGIYGIYHYCNVSVLPLGLNSGECWSRQPLRRKAGTVELCEGEMIPPGLEKAEFMRLLEHRIETACADIAIEKQRPQTDQRLDDR